MISLKFLASSCLRRLQRLKSALWYSIGQFVDDALLADELNATPQFIGALTELVYTQIGMSVLLIVIIATTPHHLPLSCINSHRPANTSRDLETFSRHAGRRAINTDDVMLLTRRNEALEDILRQELDRMKAAEGRGEQQQPTAGGKKRGRPSGGGKGKGKA